MQNVKCLVTKLLKQTSWKPNLHRESYLSKCLFSISSSWAHSQLCYVALCVKIVIRYGVE